MHKTERLDLAFAALADPTRRAILARLARGDATVAELGAPFGLRQPTISKHLKVLEEAGFVTQSQDGQRRPRRLVEGALQDVDAWLQPFRAQWERRLDNLDRYLTQSTQRPKPSRRPR
jgi:DNA-binding transcriptional ArsR family regulator